MLCFYLTDSVSGLSLSISGSLTQLPKRECDADLMLVAYSPCWNLLVMFGRSKGDQNGNIPISSFFLTLRSTLMSLEQSKKWKCSAAAGTLRKIREQLVLFVQ